MQIGGVQKTSLLDFPDKISAIVFTQGCNFRCGYCHNPELIVLRNEPSYTVDGFFEFLETRKGKLDGVVITGGEPCLQKDLIEFIRRIKDMGFLVKLDTNGSFPDVLEQALPYIDYVAMDIKAPIQNIISPSDIVAGREKAPIDKYFEIAKYNPDKILKSISLIMNSGVDYEFRTTVVKSQLTYDDFRQIGELIKGAKRYYLQKFIPSKTLDENMMNETTYSNAEFQEIKNILSEYVENVILRV